MNCVDFSGGQFVASCGQEITEGPNGQYFIQWYPNTDDQDPVTQYTIYVKAGTNTVSTTNYDYIYVVSGNVSYYLTPNIGNGNFSFLVVASNSCGPSLPSETFNYTVLD